MIRRILIACSLLTIMGCDPAREPIDVTTGAVVPGACDPWVDTVGATPSASADLFYNASGSGCGIPNGGFRFGPDNLDTAWDYFCGFDKATTGLNTWLFVCEQETVVPTTKPCAHNPAYSSTYDSPGVPGPAWAPCWKANTTSHFRRLMPGQTVSSGLSSAFSNGQGSILVSLTHLPDPPLCPYRAGTPGATQPASWFPCGTTSDSGRAEWILSSTTGAKVTGLWPSGQTGAPCMGRDAAGTTDIVATYNCPVEPRSHYDY